MIIIDGHNLIPNVSGLNLQALDDEQGLIDRLKVFSAVRRKPIEVYFDRAPAGKSGIRSFGSVKAHFIREGTTADQAIIARVRKLGKTAGNWTVVSSDRRVQVEVRALGAKVVNSQAFAAEMSEAILTSQRNPGPGKSLTEGEVEEWLRLFNEKKNTGSN
jgi:uncharacterized protein